MAYTAYEQSSPSDAAMRQVEALQQSYTASGVFTSSTEPTLIQVELHLTTIRGRIAGALAGRGYSATQTDETVLALLMEYNSRGAAYLIEVSQPSAGFVPEESQGRMAEFAKWFDDLEDVLDGEALDGLGASLIAGTSDAAGATAGGLSIAEKDTLAQDSDYPAPSFKRGQFSNTTGAGTGAKGGL